MTDLTIMILIDAFRADYVARTPYMKGLAETGTCGKLRECFGFVPRAAYFGGLNAEQYGYTNMYCFSPDNSPFRMARYVPSTIGDLATEHRLGLRQFVEDHARTRTTPFGAKYISSIEMPVQYLPFFDIAEKHAPWEKNNGYRSLFAVLDERNIPWYQCAWPETNVMADHSDAAIIEKTLSDLRPGHRFAFIHLQELDGLGHVYGPGSAEIQKSLASTDQLVKKLVESLQHRFDKVNLLLFGDHGMVNIVNTIDLWSRINNTNLRFGADLAFFLDSTMARFWFYHAQARRTIVEALSDVSCGRLLDAEDMKKYGIAKCDPKNAELIFLADPGALIFPNFFQRRGKPILGMHGYDPDCPDNLGMFLIHTPGDSRFAKFDAGNVDPYELFGLTLDLLQLPREQTDQGPTFYSRLASQKTGRFTRAADPKAEAVVEEHFARIIQAIKDRVGKPEAIVITGSFGRGEGGVFQVNNSYVPVNDYEMFVIAQENCSAILKEIANELRPLFGIDFLDIDWSDGKWQHLPHTMFNHDLKYGSQVIYGNAAILEQIPDYAAADLPVFEAVQLLLNRMAGLLTGLRGTFFNDHSMKNEERRYLTNQLIKAQIAVGDWHLIHWHCYDSSYFNRWQRFSNLARGAGLAAPIRASIVKGYKHKLYPDYADYDQPLSEIKALFPVLERAFIESCETMTSGTATTLREAVSLYVNAQSADSAGNRIDNDQLKTRLKIGSAVHQSIPDALAIRATIYAALPLLLAAALSGDEREYYFGEAKTVLGSCFKTALPMDCTFENWETVRSFLIGWWFELIHQ